MEVVVGYFAVVHRLAEVGVRRVGGAEAYRLGTREHASHESPVEAPVRILILNGRPAACSASAIFAISGVTAFGVPAGVNPLSPMVSPSLTRAAASAAEMMWCPIRVKGVFGWL